MPQVASAGNKYTFIGFLDTEGYLIGGTPTAPANGLYSGAYRVLGIKEVPVAISEPETVLATGDDDKIAEFKFNSIQPGTYIMTMAVGDLTLESYFAGTNVETIAGGTMVVNDVVDAPELNIMLIHQQRAVKQDAGVRGVAGWSGYIIPLATAQYLGRDSFSERAVATYRIAVTPQRATNFPWGVTFASNSGTAAGGVVDFQSDYPYHAVALTGDNAVVAWTLTYQPVTAGRVGAWHFRTPVTVNSVATTAPYTATLASAAGTGIKGAILYQFQG